MLADGIDERLRINDISRFGAQVTCEINARGKVAEVTGKLGFGALIIAVNRYATER